AHYRYSLLSLHPFPSGLILLGKKRLDKHHDEVGPVSCEIRCRFASMCKSLMGNYCRTSANSAYQAVASRQKRMVCLMLWLSCDWMSWLTRVLCVMSQEGRVNATGVACNAALALASELLAMKPPCR